MVGLTALMTTAIHWVHLGHSKDRNLPTPSEETKGLWLSRNKKGNKPKHGSQGVLICLTTVTLGAPLTKVSTGPPPTLRHQRGPENLNSRQIPLGVLRLAWKIPNYFTIMKRNLIKEACFLDCLFSF